MAKDYKLVRAKHVSAGDVIRVNKLEWEVEFVVAQMNTLYIHCHAVTDTEHKQVFSCDKNKEVIVAA